MKPPKQGVNTLTPKQQLDLDDLCEMSGDMPELRRLLKQLRTPADYVRRERELHLVWVQCNLRDVRQLEAWVAGESGRPAAPHLVAFRQALERAEQNIKEGHIDFHAEIDGVVPAGEAAAAEAKHHRKLADAQAEPGAGEN